MQLAYLTKSAYAREGHTQGGACRAHLAVARAGNQVSKEAGPPKAAIDIKGLCHQYGEKQVVRL